MHTLSDMRVHLGFGIVCLTSAAACTTLPSAPPPQNATSSSASDEAILRAMATGSGDSHASAPPAQPPGDYDMSYEAPAAPEAQPVEPPATHQKLPSMASKGQRKAQLFALPQNQKSK
jgi:hypothetical protein